MEQDNYTLKIRQSLSQIQVALPSCLQLLEYLQVANPVFRDTLQTCQEKC